MKKIVFFDGDGTIWYPKKTKRSKKPHWVYHTYTNYKPHLVLTPTALATLRALCKRNIVIVLLSTHPHSPKEANEILQEKVRHFHLEKYFDVVIATRTKPASKAQYIVKVLKKLSISKSQAVMVGDSYKWDYQPARQAGIDALLIDSEYRKADPKAKKVQRVIKYLQDVLEYV